MRPNRPSTTAMLVTLSRAVSHGRSQVRGFSDPVAEGLLSPGYVRVVRWARRGADREGWLRRQIRARMGYRAAFIPLRTVAIDEVVRSPGTPSQVVLLGAGLDSRAWRMPELKDAIVYEVDHPATQAYKRARVEGLQAAARAIRFVPVDFEHRSLEEALEEAGHRRREPTLWIWEGVTAYLRPEAVDATLKALAERSAPGSRAATTYVAPRGSFRLSQGIVWSVVRAVAHEPFFCLLHPEEMARRFEAVGFRPLSDTGIEDWARSYGSELLPPRSGNARSAERLLVAEKAPPP